MSEIHTPAWWVAETFINILDFVKIYVMAHATVRHNIKVKPMHVLFCIAYALILSLARSIFGDEVFWFISYGGMMLVIAMVTKRHNLGDIVTILAIFAVVFTIIEVPILAIVWLVRNEGYPQFPFDFVMAQSISAVLVLLLHKVFKLNEWLNVATKNIAIKLGLFVSLFIIIVVSRIIGFGDSPSIFAMFMIIISVIGVPIMITLKKLYYNAITIISIHDLKNSLLALGIAMEGIDNIDVLKNNLRHISKEFGTGLSQLDNYESKFEKNLQHRDIMAMRVSRFINSKIKICNNKEKVVANVSYKKDYENVDFILILKWLGTLLDNAIEATRTNPVYIYVGVSDYFLTIRTENEYTGDGGQDIKVVLEEGYSTEDGRRGIGLYTLNQQVTEKGGRVELEEYYAEGFNCYYLQISILFDKKNIVV